MPSPLVGVVSRSSVDGIFLDPSVNVGVLLNAIHNVKQMHNLLEFIV